MNPDGAIDILIEVEGPYTASVCENFRKAGMSLIVPLATLKDLISLKKQINDLEW